MSGVGAQSVGEQALAPLLRVNNLSVGFPTESGQVEAVRDISFDVQAGEFVGLVGESGSGKTLTALALMRLVAPPGVVRGGSIELDGQDLLGLTEKEMCKFRGARIGMVFQEPMTALNPVFTIGFQIAEAVRAHRKLSKAQALTEAERLLELVAMPEPKRRLKDYPHLLSGGQRQRVMIAIALASSPDLLLADEPTTALDVTVQAQILELLERLRQELSLAVFLITHDLAVVAETCDRVLVMYSGQIVEKASAENLFRSPAHPYTRGLLSSLPRLGGAPQAARSVSDRLTVIPGQVPDLANRPGGCAFHPRCDEVMDRCREAAPDESTAESGTRVRCFLHQESVGEAELSK